jgi:hypothetical protein
MSKFIRTTALAATFAAAALMAATPAAAVTATSNASATARIIRPLVLASTQNLDLGTIVLTGSGTYTAAVGIDRAGVFNCDGGSSSNVACSGTPTPAAYNVQGTQGQVVTIAAGNVTMTGSNGGTLTLTPDFAPTVTLANSGTPGTNFGVGGSITVGNGTTDGVYTGTFAVTADYQ